MRKLIIVLILIFIVSGYAHAQTRAYGKETLTVAGTAIGFTAATLADTGGTGDKSDKIIFQVETAQIRYWMDGSTPTASVGLIGNIGDEITLTGKDVIEKFRAIRTGSTSAVLSAQFFTD